MGLVRNWKNEVTPLTEEYDESKGMYYILHDLESWYERKQRKSKIGKRKISLITYQVCLLKIR